MKKIFAIMGIVICMCLSGCQLNKSDIDETPTNNYDETEVSMPEEISNIMDIAVDKEENIKLISTNKSNDQIEVWERSAKDEKWVSKYNLMQVANIDSPEQLETASISKDGEVFCGIVSKSGKKEYIYINEKLEPKKLDDLSSSLNEGDLIPNICYNSENVLMAYNLPRGVSVIDEETGKIQQKYLEDKSAMVLSADQYKNKLSIITSDRASTFDTDTQKEIEVDKNVQNFMSDQKQIRKNKYISTQYIYYQEFEGKECLYGVSEDGIYRYQNGKSGVKLVNGNQTSIGSSNLFLVEVIVADYNKFYALMNGDDGSKLYKYEENNQKKETIHIFSIENSQVLQEAIISFKSKHKDVAIELEVGVDGEGSLTFSDIIRKLNTEILSGNGPDIIMTDGIALENYLDGDNLMDLSDIVDEVGKSEGLLENIVNTYKDEGKIYAVPARLAVMAVSGSENVVKNSANIEEMMAALESEKGDNPTLSAWSVGHMATILYRSDLALKYYEAGALQKEDVNAFYEMLARMYNLCDMDEAFEGGKAIDKSFVDLEITPQSYGEIGDVAKQQLASIDYISSIYGYMEHVMAGKDEVMFSTINKSRGNIFYPFSTIAINSNTEKSEICKAFVKSFLSGEVQGKVRYAGIPVNLAAINKFEAEITEEGKRYKTYSLNEKEWEAFNQLLEDLNVNSPYDVTVMDIVLNNAEDFLRNNKSKDEAVDTVMKKLSIYQAE